jgi:hypothetical protein
LSHCVISLANIGMTFVLEDRGEDTGSLDIFFEAPESIIHSR